jgi:hypothetical protein
MINNCKHAYNSVWVQVKMNISRIRENTTQSMWLMTTHVPLLNQSNWTTGAVDMLKVSIPTVFHILVTHEQEETTEGKEFG